MVIPGEVIRAGRLHPFYGIAFNVVWGDFYVVFPRPLHWIVRMVRLCWYRMGDYGWHFCLWRTDPELKPRLRQSL